MPLNVYFDNISDDEVIEELVSRVTWDKNKSFKKILEVLTQLGCPRELLEPIKEWNKIKVVNDIDLRNWKEACQKELEGK